MTDIYHPPPPPLSKQPRENGCISFLDLPEYSRLHPRERNARLCVLFVLTIGFLGVVAYLFSRLFTSPPVIRTYFEQSQSVQTPGLVVCGARVKKPPSCEYQTLDSIYQECPGDAMAPQLRVQNFAQFLADSWDASWPCWVFQGGNMLSKNSPGGFYKLKLSVHTDLVLNDTSDRIPPPDRFLVVGMFNPEQYADKSYLRHVQPMPVLGPATLQVRFTRQQFKPVQGAPRIFLAPTVFVHNTIKYFSLDSDVLSIIQMEPFNDSLQEVNQEVSSFTFSDFFTQVGGVISITFFIYQFLFGTPRIRPFGVVQRVTLRDTGSPSASYPPAYAAVGGHPMSMAEAGSAGGYHGDGLGPAAMYDGDTTVYGSRTDPPTHLSPASSGLTASEERIANAVLAHTKQFLARYYVRNIGLASRIDTHVVAQHHQQRTPLPSRATSIATSDGPMPPLGTTGHRSRYLTAATEISVNSSVSQRQQQQQQQQQQQALQPPPPTQRQLQAMPQHATNLQPHPGARLASSAAASPGGSPPPSPLPTQSAEDRPPDAEAEPELSPVDTDDRAGVQGAGMKAMPGAENNHGSVETVN